MTDKNHRWIYTYDYADGQVWEPWRGTEGVPGWLAGEADRAAARAAARLSDGTVSFILMADNHYVINGTWDDTAEAVRMIGGRLPLGGVIHLGDFTDGMTGRELTARYVRGIIGDFAGLGLKCFAAVGNHDWNCFRGSTDKLTVEEQCELYLNGMPQRYYTDCGNSSLRLFFIDSFDPDEGLRYGFKPECIDWLDETLRNTPDNLSAVIFSHVPPLARLQVWAKEIRNGEALVETLNRYADKIIAFINGHNHCDLLFNDPRICAFPIISINCAKCEYFLEHKPEGAVVPYRELGARTQESFDILTADPKNRRLYFTRFGAGDDRIVENGTARWI